MPRTSIVAIRRFGAGAPAVDHDLVAAEAPVAIELARVDGGERRSLGVLMRTPGDDVDLVRGWLYTEHLISAIDDIVSITPETHAEDARLLVTLAAHVDFGRIVENRALTPTSACGFCGRLAVEHADQLRVTPSATREPLAILTSVVAGIPASLRAGQAVFAETGGLHAAGLFDAGGECLAIREDIGRHNAVDKLVGAALAAGWLPASHAILAVSGRVAFEIVQKAVAAGVAAVVAVGAPSSLAVEAAVATGLTLVGFARDGKFNVYAGHQRIVLT